MRKEEKLFDYTIAFDTKREQLTTYFPQGILFLSQHSPRNCSAHEPMHLITFSSPSKIFRCHIVLSMRSRDKGELLHLRRWYKMQQCYWNSEVAKHTHLTKPQSSGLRFSTHSKTHALLPEPTLCSLWAQSRTQSIHFRCKSRLKLLHNKDCRRQKMISVKVENSSNLPLQGLTCK